MSIKISTGAALILEELIKVKPGDGEFQAATLTVWYPVSCVCNDPNGFLMRTANDDTFQKYIPAQRRAYKLLLSLYPKMAGHQGETYARWDATTILLMNLANDVYTLVCDRHSCAQNGPQVIQMRKL